MPVRVSVQAKIDSRFLTAEIPSVVSKREFDIFGQLIVDAVQIRSRQYHLDISSRSMQMYTWQTLRKKDPPKPGDTDKPWAKDSAILKALTDKLTVKAKTKKYPQKVFIGILHQISHFRKLIHQEQMQYYSSQTDERSDVTLTQKKKNSMLDQLKYSASDQSVKVICPAYYARWIQKGANRQNAKKGVLRPRPFLGVTKAEDKWLQGLAEKLLQWWNNYINGLLNPDAALPTRDKISDAQIYHMMRRKMPTAGQDRVR